MVGPATILLGPWFFIHATFLLAFILPYVGKVLALTAADHARQSMGFVESTLPPFVRVEDIPAWRVLVGLERGWWVPVLGLVLLMFNAIRGVLTVRVGMLRDAEERAGISPALREYMGSQKLEEESVLRSLANLASESGRWLWWVVRRQDLSSSDAPAPGLWRWHRLLNLLFWVAILSFSIHAVDWAWNTTLPRVTVEKPAILDTFMNPTGMDRP